MKDIFKIFLLFITSLSLFSSCTDLPKGLRGNELILYGNFIGEKFGFSLDFIGDVNADGFADIAVGAPFNNIVGEGAGAVYIFLGPFDAAAIQRTPDITITGFVGSNFGYSIAGGFDFNSDGISDFAVSSKKSMFGSQKNGDVFIYYGDSSLFVKSTIPIESLDSSQIVITGEDLPKALVASSGFGYSLDRIGDFDRDGIVDLAVSAPSSTYNSKENAGALFIFLSGRSLNNSLISSGLADYIFTGSNSNEKFGSSFSNALNLDGQGNSVIGFEDDFIVGAPGVVGSSGKAYVFLGPSNNYLSGIVSSALSSRSLEGSEGDENFGNSLTYLKDIDGDGLDDFAVSSKSGELQKTYLYYGRLAEAPIDTKSLIIEGDFLALETTGALASYFAGTAGSLVIGAPYGGLMSLSVGAAYIFDDVRLRSYPKYATTAINMLEISRIISNSVDLSESALFSTAMSADGDINADNLQDLLIGAPGGSVNGKDSGYAVLAF